MEVSEEIQQSLQRNIEKVDKVDFNLQLFNDKLAILGLIIILSIVILGALAPYLAPYDPIQVNLTNRLQAPNQEFVFGTDHLGRCLFSRVLFGVRTSLAIPFFVLLASILISILLGTMSGYLGGKIDELIMGVINILLALPSLVLALAIAGLLGPSLLNLMIALVATYWVNYARIIRGMVISIKQNEYILAAKACGASEIRIIVKHILPNIISPIIVLATLDMGYIILSVSSLSFLGLGAQPPTAEWGAMLNAARSYFQLAPWLMFFPGMAILLVVLGFNLLGDGLRDVFDPNELV
ncbi:ABC transporter permease [Natroniella acetigena]|uniref:nickel transporter permease n=1 Tax=Natroniella acetigena TaxID=52004 RepID=UPI00200A6EC8|nr:nickel transporter permease [Natroniella acetigena]MCK8827165.1 ABC transporter permease [Natroniella acetigena]